MGTTTTLIESAYDRPDYRDQFSVNVRPDHYRNIDEVVIDWFTKQPAWIRLLSTNSLSRKGIEAAVRTGGYAVGSKVGSWEVINRSADEIMFGDNMVFMEYRFSLRYIESELRVEGSTAVRYLWPRTGRYYFAAVRPMHRRFIRFLLDTTTK